MKKLFLVLPVALALCGCDKKSDEKVMDLTCGNFHVEATMYTRYADMKITRTGEDTSNTQDKIDSVLPNKGDIEKVRVPFARMIVVNEEDPDTQTAKVYEDEYLEISLTLVPIPGAKLPILPLWKQSADGKKIPCFPYGFFDNQEK